MKPLNLIILTVLGFSTLKNNAQITITNADMPEWGDIFIYDISTDLLTEDFSLTGASYSWDYSLGTSSQVDSLSIVSVGSTPIAYQLYFNNQFTQPDYYSDYAQAGQDLDVMGQVTIEERYDYYGINTNSLEIKGFGAKVNQVPASVKYDTIDQVYPFPMTYGMAVHNSVGYYLATVPSLGTYGQWIRREVTVDGYGSLTTPNATYPNTLRVKTELLQTDTVYVDQFGFGQTFDRPDETIYEWFTNTEKSPVMRVVVSGGQVNEVKYLLEVTSGTDELESTQTALITINSEGIYQVQSDDMIQSVKAYNLKGQVIESNLTNCIDITGYPKGMYLIVVESEGRKSCFKVVK